MDAALHPAVGITGENIGVNGADAGAGQHGHHQFGNHGQIQGHAVALFYLQGVQGRRHPAYVGVQHLIGIGPHFHFAFALPDERGLVAAVGDDMAIHAVIGGVQAAADVPAHAGSVEIRILHFVPGLEPVQQRARPLRPEGVAVGPGQFTQGFVFLATTNARHVLAVAGRKIAAVFVEQVADAVLRHGNTPSFESEVCVTGSVAPGWNRNPCQEND